LSNEQQLPVFQVSNPSDQKMLIKIPKTGLILVAFERKCIITFPMRRGIFLLALITMASTAFSQDYKLHPVYIYSFTKYIVWPDAYKEGDFEILVLGDSPILKELNAMAGAKKTPDNRKIVVTKINSPSEIKKCNVLFVPASKSKALTEVLSKVGSQSILVITEEEGLGAKGANINFVIRDGKLFFELNQSSINKQNLKASTELSRLAIQI
jgi:hypothetical protein